MEISKSAIKNAERTHRMCCVLPNFSILSQMFTVKRTETFFSKHNHYQSYSTFQQHKMLHITRPSNPLRSSGYDSKIIIPPRCFFVIILFFSYPCYFRQKGLGESTTNSPNRIPLNLFSFRFKFYN